MALGLADGLAGHVIGRVKRRQATPGSQTPRLTVKPPYGRGANPKHVGRMQANISASLDIDHVE